MNPPAGLGFGHPLDPVHAALEFQPGPGPAALHREADFLYSPQLGFVHRVHLHLPAAGVGVHGVHTEQGVGEQGRFLPAHSGANLDNDVFLVVGVPGQEQNLDCFLQALQVGLGLLKFLLGQLLHVRVPHEGLSVAHILPPPGVGPVGAHHRLQLPLLLVEAGHQGRVGIGLRRPQAGFQVREVELQGAQFFHHIQIKSPHFSAADRSQHIK